jgi:hypothetical protein
VFHDTAEKGGVKSLFPFSYLTPPLSFYWIDTNQGRFVLRLAPPDDAGFLFYEQRMMRQEPALHALIRAHTTIPVAEIVAFDFSQARIDRYGIAPPLAAYLGVPSVPAPETLVAHLVGRRPQI